MKIREHLNGITVMDLMLSAQNDFFRVEALESYNAPEEKPMRDQYDSGATMGPSFTTNNPWFAKISEMKEKGHPVRRVRAMSRDWSRYIRFEMEWGYNPISQIGEEYNIILKEQHPKLSETWDEEYYIIDNKRLVYIRYDDTGKTLGLEEEKNPAEILRRIEHKRLLLEHSTPYSKFLAHLRKNVKISIPDIPSVA